MNFDEWGPRIGYGFAGAAMAFAVGVVFLMSPDQMFRWVLAAGTKDEKVGRALDPQTHLDEMRAKLLDAQSRALQCNTNDSSSARQIDAASRTDSKCITGVDGLHDQIAYAYQASSFLGGRIHISALREINNFGCEFLITTGTDIELKSYKWGARLEVQTDIGKYQVVPISQAYWYMMPAGCKFDILKIAAAAPEEPARSKARTGTVE